MSVRDSLGFLRLEGLAPRDRRAILLGLAVLLPVGLYTLGVRPYRNALEDIQDRTAAERELLARELDLLSEGSALPDRIEEARAQVAQYQGHLLQGGSEVLAEAELSDFLETSAFRNRVLLEEIRSGELGRGEEPPPGLSVLRLHLRGESDLEGVLTFLNEIERSTLLLRIRGLALEPEVRRPDSEDQEDNRQPVPTGVVEFQLIVDGFARGEEYGS